MIADRLTPDMMDQSGTIMNRGGGLKFTGTAIPGWNLLVPIEVMLH
jgi:hypothetical protein